MMSRLGGRVRGAGFAGLVLALLAGLFVSLTLAVIVGPVPISPLTVWRIALYKTTGLFGADWSVAQEQIVWQIRFPRVLLAAVVGAGLAVVGATLQAVVRNPLADPFILGGSSGASVGAVLVIIAGLSVFGVYSLSVAAFLGATGAFVLVFVLARGAGGTVSPVRLVLSGVAVSYALSAVTSFLIFRAEDSDQIRSVLFWMLGSLGGARWEYLTAPAVVLLLGSLYLVLRARELNALLVGEESAATLGVDTARFRKELLVLTGLLTGAMVAVSGSIGFVGLMMPHIVRLLVGSDHRRVLPVCVLVGGIFLVWVDVLARTAVAPEELPVGVVTSLIGAPFFVWLMRRKANAANAFGGGGT
jgi:iron complex transport system permease protein